MIQIVFAEEEVGEEIVTPRRILVGVLPVVKVCTDESLTWQKMCGTINASFTLQLLDGTVEYEIWNWESDEICSN